jgi:hypothetical protein
VHLAVGGAFYALSPKTFSVQKPGSPSDCRRPTPAQSALGGAKSALMALTPQPSKRATRPLNHKTDNHQYKGGAAHLMAKSPLFPLAQQPQTPPK